MGRKELEAEIRKLDLKDRAALARSIVESLDDLSEAEVVGRGGGAPLGRIGAGVGKRGVR